MNLSNEFHPKLTDAALVFSSTDGVFIEELKCGIRRFIGRHHPNASALFMTQALNFNYLRAKDRRSRVVIVTPDGSPQARSIIIDLYARLLHNGSEIRTPRAVYSATLDGNVEAQRLAVLAQHYFWMTGCFGSDTDRSGERHLLN